MITFEVKDMTCGHCAGTITKAVAAVDQGAKVQIDLDSHRVRIEPATAGAQTLEEAIREAGYTPVVLAAPAAAPQGGCGCR